MIYMHRELLNCGEKLNINENYYVIEKILGKGGSVIAYMAKSQSEYDNNYYVIKELYPSHLDLRRNNKLDIYALNDNDKEQFEKYKKEYINATKQQIEIRNNISDAMNSTISASIYFEHNTCYILEPLFNGVTYDDCIEKNIENLLKRIKALCKVISAYHGKEYLHLDIKPTNIYVIPETCEYILLVDFDSVVKEEEKNSIIVRYSENWAAPEQIVWNGSDKITKATDIFSIGEVLFYKLFGRHSFDSERRPFSKYNYREVLLLKGVNPKVEELLTELFHHTICYNSLKRYQSVDTLIDMLDEMINVVKCPIYLKSTHLVKNINYVSRDEDNKKLYDMLCKNDRIIVSGWGGIGKSEFIKNYFAVVDKQSDVVIYHSYEGNWMNFVTKGMYQNIYGYISDADDAEIQYEQMIKVLSDLTDKLDGKVTIIVDNVTRSAFMSTEEKYRRMLLNMNAKFIFISRENIESNEFEKLKIDRLGNDKLLQIIQRNTGISCEKVFCDKNYIEIIDYLGGHTLAVELVSKMMNNELLEPEEMLAKLMLTRLKKSSEKVSYEKDGTNKGEKSAFEHIAEIYNITSLSKPEVDILANLSVLPSSGINIRVFRKFAALKNMNIVNALISKGWLTREDETIVIHPLISEVVCSTKVRKYRKFLRSVLSYYIDNNGNFTLEERKTHSQIIISIREALKRQKNTTEEFFDFLEMDNQYAPIGIIELLDGYNYGLELMKNNDYDKLKMAKAFLNYGNVQEYFCSAEEVRQYYLKGKEIIEKNKLSFSTIEYPLTLFLIGSTYADNDREKAINYLNEAMRYVTDLDKEKDLKILMADIFATKAYIIEREGVPYDYEQVINLRKQTIECYYDYFEGESKWTALSYCKLARNYVDANDISTAEKYCKKALLVNTNLLGEDAYETAFPYQVMGEIYQKLNQYSEAKIMFEKALEILKDYWGVENEENNLQIIEIKDSLDELLKVM